MEINDYITGTFSLIAIGISIIAYHQNLKGQKRELRIGKIEEMLEITHLLNANYQYFEDTQNFKNNFLSGHLESIKKEKYLEQVEYLHEISNEMDLKNKLSRLYVLSNSYLPKKKLKAKIGVFITVYAAIAENTLSQPTNKIDQVFNEFPRIWEFLEFIEEIQNELIEEMSLGYKNNISEKNDYEKEFKRRYKLK
ncbi:hypothetical protein B4N84_11975 [Flavobacterium sp. IR1]|nr:hypothetical protein B4N84_11975 [Flavobacterium sp. IR1]